ncbi:MAG: phasin family protein [Gammaproteobacteria bacterium]|nr:phasin family protein [Gammaproteobacteria bacterium]
MQFEIMEPWAQFGTTCYASLKELGEISTKTFEKLGEQQLGLVNAYVDTGIKHVTLLTESKGYTDLVARQTKLMTEYNENMLDAVRKTTDIMTDSKDEMAAWFEQTQENGNGTAPVKKAALAVKKATA